MDPLTRRPATVVGGGIGGLAAALALQRTGWEVTVRERRTSLDRGGAGLVLWPNALRCLDLLGVGDAVRQAGTALDGVAIRRPDGRPVSSLVTEPGARRPLAILRADLVDALAGALEPSVLTLDATVSDIESLPGDLVVGADGLRSTVRRALGVAVEPASRGYTVWRAVVPPGVAPLEDPRELCETWGAGVRVGTVPLGGRGTYLYASAPLSAAGPARTAETELAWLRRRFADWHAPVPALLRAIEPSTLLRHDVADLPPGRVPLHRGRYALVGDAGHAMEPNLGQGAGLALEDAVVLAHALTVEPTVAGALSTYDDLRAPRAASLARQSRRIGQLSRLTQPHLVALRDAAMRMTPDRATRRASAAAHDWRPPATPHVHTHPTAQEPA